MATEHWNKGLSMMIENPKFLRSLRNEAERQADFYNRRGDTSMFEFWSDVASEVTQAMQTGATFCLLLRENSGLNPLPIKDCAQQEQLPKHNPIKAFQ